MGQKPSRPIHLLRPSSNGITKRQILRASQHKSLATRKKKPTLPKPTWEKEEVKK